MGEVINLVNDFKVYNVIFNYGEYNDLENELIDVLCKSQYKNVEKVENKNVVFL